MIFSFQKYVQPTHYFTMPRPHKGTVFPVASELPIEVKEQLGGEFAYSCKLAVDYDISYRAVQLGYIPKTEATYTTIEQLPLEDEYLFIRTYFHSIWATYILLLRILGFKNPYKEIKAWHKTRTVSRKPIYKKPFVYNKWHSFTSSLIEENPLITVVIPTLNRYSYLKEVLRDFEKQSYRHFEIIVVDQSDPFEELFYTDFELNIRVIRQTEPALWLARNTAIREAKGTYVAFSEDDVRVPENWITMHLKAIDFFKADISAGVFFPEGEEISQERSFYALASQFASGNAMVRKSLFNKTGLFDRQFEKQRMGDGAFGFRCYLEGFLSVSNPLAYCLDVKASTGGLRQMGSWDAFRPKKWLSPRPVPSVLYFYRKYFGAYRACLAMLKSIPPSVMPYRYKKNKKMLILGIVCTPVLIPLLLVQMTISWRKATIKLKQGPKIESL